MPNACLSLLKIIYNPELISRGSGTGRFCNGLAVLTAHRLAPQKYVLKARYSILLVSIISF